MKRPAINAMIKYWKNEFDQQIELEEYKSGEQFLSIPSKFQKKFRFELYPQPFYGYFSENMKDDILMPLLNPGPVTTRHVTDLFKGHPYPEAKRL